MDATDLMSVQGGSEKSHRRVILASSLKMRRRASFSRCSPSQPDLRCGHSVRWSSGAVERAVMRLTLEMTRYVEVSDDLRRRAIRVER